MRIVAGEFKGRKLKPPPLPARATEGRIREAWFNILAAEVPGAKVLDLFAGSGALGLEALSRGASYVTMVERSRKSIRSLEANIATLKVEGRTSVVVSDVFRYLESRSSAAASAMADLAFADPPFSGDDAIKLVDVFRTRPFARILVVEHSGAIQVSGDDHRRYGDVALTFCYL